MSSEAIVEEFQEYIQKISHLEEAIGLMTWDLRTGAPKKGAARRGEVIGTLSSEVFQLSTSSHLKEMISHLNQEETWISLDEITKGSVKECEKTIRKFENVPADEFKAFIILTAQAEQAWEDAKDKGDFASFQPYLEKIVDYQRNYADWKGFKGNRYNALLDDFEPGLTTDTIDEVFTQLKEAIVPLVEKISKQNAPETNYLFKKFPVEQQKRFSRKILESMQYDFQAGRLDTTVHPFAIGLNPGDVRVTTKYDEFDFRTAVFGTIHEGGHALYEQNIHPSLAGTPLAGGTSMGIHESQSLFWENFIGRRFGFWEKHFDLLKEFAPGQFQGISLDEFYKAVNVAGPSLIRIEADELTYCLHIILRYELEKALINGDIEVTDLPEKWNEKMEELLGIKPSHDGEGVLQDVHWAGGAFGYFPSYALGYVYAAQLQAAMQKDLPQFEELISSGNLAPIKEWLTENVHQHGKLKDPLQILHDAAGEKIDASHLIHYLTDKYEEVYNLREQ
ncbi:carboxypeptidase M32 [Alkalicoccus daliensis]|uniref:Metal-dependent carboxypeptidase n=1 Tax=Alkalicoccus daliensis TaxID=745820 RepID=A0A1H0AGP8_9BACI|nr:carboxypeptidase M32 [Alkalicoccus daliensis]SDN32554.1 carboxypeptidase Taq [Alkalicoccus daliensis]